MEVFDRKNLANLFELYALAAQDVDSVRYGQQAQFSFVSAYDTAWPQMFFGLEPEALDKPLIENISSINCSLPVRLPVILQHEPVSLKLFKECGWRPVSQWLGMYLEDIEYALSVKGSDDVSYSLVANEQDLSGWISVVSEELFQSKKLDPSLFRFLSTRDVWLVKATFEDLVIGAAMLFIDNSNIAGIYMVSVTGRMKGKGIGKGLMNYCFDQMRMRGITTCVLQSTKAGFPLYKSLGFTQSAGFNLYVQV